ncbi:cadherin-like domain-containing protein [Bosea sp. (in: a-proteobacteria)]|uniref:cadherin-like domain-containing protein n=1 Tax=Bosea sp. (in: a-proteobacteria) TaxID=1871050 RepID=UPI002633837B|nr:cadherin-like domain-containing protein [Bosea sp. (in: a-proteobacteria)]MCO5090808.1 VCBS domain-containing protein [Bosea sp. (in: a-proteobacteria)]
MFDAAAPATAVALTADHAAGADAGKDAATGHDAAEAAQKLATDAVADVGPFGAKAEAQLIRADSASQAQRHEIVFVDARLPELAQLTPAEGVEIVVLDPERDGLEQVNAALAGRSGIDAVHFVGHGGSEGFSIGRTLVDAALVAARGAEIAGWSAALSADADIMIWGCDVAAAPAGQALLDSLALLTGGDIAASDGKTGSEERGGDWVLEVETGAIETAVPFTVASLSAWSHLLAPPVITGDLSLQMAEPSVLNPDFGTSSQIRLGDVGWGLAFGVADAADLVTVTVTVADDDIGAFTDTAGGGVPAGSAWSFAGTKQQADAWLKGLVFTAADAERGNVIAATDVTVSVTNEDDAVTASRTMSIRVTASNDPTVLADVAIDVDEVDPAGNPSVTVLDGTMIQPLDPEVAIGAQEASQIVYTLHTTASYGYLALGGVRIGTGSTFTQADVAAGRLTYVHTVTGADQNTPDSFVVHVNDGATPLTKSAVTTVTLNIRPVNQAPVVSGTGPVYEGQPQNASGPGTDPARVGDYIVANGGGDPGDDALLTVRLTSLPADGKLWFKGTAMIGDVAEDIDRAITAADILAGFSFAYADRRDLTYSHNGDDQPDGRPNPFDSFGVEVTDGGGGAGADKALKTSATITLRVLPVNDEPAFDPLSTLTATVPDTGYQVVLTPAMLNVTDPDSANDSLSFVITTAQYMDQGRLYLAPPGNVGPAAALPVGSTFTLADVIAGRVSYVQQRAAGPNETDSFGFRVVDNGVSLHWTADGEPYQRPSGIYEAPGDQDSALRDFTFTINLRDTPAGNGGSMLDDPLPVPASHSSTYAGTNAAGVSVGSLSEGGAVLLYDDDLGRPGLSYEVPGVAPAQIIYTVMGFGSADAGWHGTLEKSVGGVWTAIDLLGSFTQADLDAGLIRFVHDGEEGFDSSVTLRASAGLYVSDGLGGLTLDAWTSDFHFYATPVNDAPEGGGSAENVIKEGDTVAITSGMLHFSDPDDAVSETHYETSPTLAGGANYALNHDAANPLAFYIDTLPLHGRLEWFDTATNGWKTVDETTLLQADWLTASAGTSRLRYVHDGSETLADVFSAHAVDRRGAVSGAVSVGFVITPVNDPPDIAPDPRQPDPPGPWPGGGGNGAVNEPLTVIYEGSWQKITPALLQAVDPDSSATQVQYSITQAPQHGRIAYSTDGIHFTSLGSGSSFTQADVAAGFIYYQHGGDEPGGASYPDTPDDKFVFTLSDGSAEVRGREFWIYVQPTNDAPVVTAPAGPVNSTDTVIALPGFSLHDPDLADGVGAKETDFLQVTVRLLDRNGVPLTAANYTDMGITIAVAGDDLDLDGTIDVTTSGAIVDDTAHGAGRILVLRGTQAQLNAALATLTVGFATDRNEIYRVQVIADDRLRDQAGALLDVDPVAAGDNVGGNGGGTFNQPAVPYIGLPQSVSDYDGFDWYLHPVPTASHVNPAIAALVGNIGAADVLIRASRVNDPAVLTGAGAATTYEDQATLIGPQIAFTITDAESAAFGTPVSVTLSVPFGTLSLDPVPDGLNLTVTGAGTGTMVVTGTAADIRAGLNAALRYQSASDQNHDMNGADPGDVTLTVSFDDTGSNIGSGGASANPPPLAIALTIVPVNDAPTVSAPADTLVVSVETPVTGISVADRDIAGDGGGIADGEADFIQVTIRLIALDTATPLSAAAHVDVVFSSSSAPLEGPDFEVDNTYDGTNRALVIRGTLAEVNAYLAGLRVGLSGALANQDQGLRIEIVADDRQRDVGSGVLVGTAANGGGNAEATGGVTAVPGAEVDPYLAVPGGLPRNVASATRTIFPTSLNDPPEIHVTLPAPMPSEGAATVRLSGIAISDPDALPADFLTARIEVSPNVAISGHTLPAGSTLVGTDATSRTISGTLAQINAFANSIIVQYPDTAGTPDSADWNGSFTVTVTVSDEGKHGGRPPSLTDDTNDPAADPGDFAYADGVSAELVTTRTFTITVAPVNDAPVVVPVGGSTIVSLSETEDTSGTARTVATLFGAYFDDSRDAIPGGSSADSFAGVMVVGLSPNPAQGSWQYYNGASWVDIGARALTNALYLDAGAQIRFAPAADFHGTPERLTVRLAETQASPPATGAVRNLSAANATGGTSHYSAGAVVLETTVANVNDKPGLGPGDLTAVNEDEANPAGETVSVLFGALYSDATDDRSGIAGGGDAKTPFGGIAITGNAANPATEGRWQYSLDGTVWSYVATDVGDGNALLLPTSAMLRFVPVADYNGVPGGLTVRGSDATVGFAGGVDLSGALGQTGQWSDATTLDTRVLPRNDAPVLTGTAADPIITENNETGTGSSLPPTLLFETGTVTLSDLDLTTTPGLSAGVFGAGEIELSLGATYLTGDRLGIAAGFTLPPGIAIDPDPARNGSAGTLVIRLAAGTTLADVTAVIEHLTYASSSDNPTDFGARTTRSYTLVVRDGDNRDAQGDTAGGPGSLASAPLQGAITIVATNDPPIAENNERTIVEDTASVAGNVITDPSPSPANALDRDPDTRVADLRISAVAFGGTAGAVGSALDGTYGRLTLNANGSYVYLLDNTDPRVNALRAGDELVELFTYTLSDGDKTDDATLRITIQGRTDGVPAIGPVDLNGGATGQNTVSEAGLGDPGDASETTSGTVTVTALDGLASIAVGGTTLNLTQLGALGGAPVTVTTPKGVLTLTGFTPGTTVGGVPTTGTLSYSYTLTTAQDHSGGEVSDPFALRVTDAGGGTSTGTLTILIADDAPQARNDATSVQEDGPAATGNVFGGGGAGDAADDIGSDGPAAGGPVTGVRFGGTAGTVGSALDGTYGALTLNANGSYSYALDNADPRVNALRTGQTLTEVFTYRIADKDGSTAEATLTITIEGRKDGLPAIGPVDLNGGATGQNTVSERGLNDAGDPSETTAGTVTLTAPDGLASISVGGTTLNLTQLGALGGAPVTVTTPKGVLTLTAFAPGTTVGGVPTSGTLSYSYTLTTAQDHSGGEVSDAFLLGVTDAGGDTSAGTLTILITDDAPRPLNDAATITEDAALDTVSGNVFANGGAGDVADNIGNDGPAAGGPVTGVWSQTAPGVGTVGSTLAGAYGTLKLNADGSYDYRLDNGNAAVNALNDTQTLADVFRYEVTDSDGSTAEATLTITIRGTTDGAATIVPVDANGSATGENTVGERGLGDPGDGSETTTGTVTVTAPDGLVSVTVGGTTITLDSLRELDTTPVTVKTPMGVLTITGFTPGTIVGGVPTSGTLAYRYTLTGAQDHGGGEVSESILLTVTDAGGGTGTGTLTILIADDAPQARDDAAAITRGGPADTVTGNVVTTGPGADRPGADGVSVTRVAFDTKTGTVGSPLAGRYGELTLNADGSYSYRLDNANPRVEALLDGETLTEVFSYRITDADGNQSTATLTITIAGKTEIFPGVPGWPRGWPASAAYVETGVISHLEGQPYDRYVTFLQTVSQQVVFRSWAGTTGPLLYEATLGIGQPLPSWISFEPTTQTVTARPTPDVPPGIYVVRVIARDANGNYAESSVSFRVLRDIAESLRLLRSSVPAIASPDMGPAPIELPPADPPPQREAPADEVAPEPDGGGTAPSAPEAPRPAKSLTQALIQAGAVGQLLEAAKLLEALTPEPAPKP